MDPRIRVLLGVTASVAMPLLAGCGGGSSTTLPDPQPRSVSAALPDGLTATLAEDRSVVAVGGVVTYTMTLTNATGSPITYRPVISGAAPSGNVPAAPGRQGRRGRHGVPGGRDAAVHRHRAEHDARAGAVGVRHAGRRRQ